MRKQLINSLKLILLIPIAILIYLIGVLIINTIYDYKPLSSQIENIPKTGSESISATQCFSILSWNIGYGGLGKDADFFYDGGKMSAPEESDYIHCFNGILESLYAFDSLDFILLQEVDTASSRSYYTNQYREILNLLRYFNGVFLKNYDVFYVPVPIFNPMARVVSGLSFFSAHPPSRASLVVFPDNYSWPKNLFMPDRCFQLISYELDNGKKLHVINTHNSAFDEGLLRKAQLKLLFIHMKSLYENGDYVIAGGDWNINPPGYNNQPFISGDIPARVAISTNLFKTNITWSVIFDPDYPTNRDVSSPYVPGLSPTTIIDFFVCSPNIRVLDAQTFYNGFRFADHQPIYLQFELK